MSLDKISGEGILEDSIISYPIVSERFEFMSHFAFMPSRRMFPNGSMYWTISQKDVKIEISSNINIDVTKTLNIKTVWSKFPIISEISESGGLAAQHNTLKVQGEAR